ncbi:MAG: S-layer homology domain-containing protein [Clostridia bacterium]|nr:S-layer homology domain-containing protein [Clostridia bacterium]
MKKICKSLLLTLLAVALVFNTFGIVLATSTTASIAVREEALEGGVSKLVFKVTTPTGADGVSMMNIVFSYDESKVQLIDSYDAETEITSADLDYAFNAIDQGRISLTPSVLSASKNGRTAIAVSVSAPAAKSFDATAGADVLEFYYKIKDGKEADSETFTLEKDVENGSFVAGFYPTASNRIPAFVSTITVSGSVSTPSEQYKYVGGASDTLSMPTFTYEGSDNLVLKSLEITASAESVNVPTTYPAQEDATVTFTAKATPTVGETMNVPETAVWSVVGELPTGVTFDAAAKKLTVGKNAVAGTAVVKIADGDISDTVEVAIVKADAVATKLEIKANGNAVGENALTVVKPAVESAAAKTVEFTGKIYDQYGAEFAGTVSFSTVDTSEKVTFANNTLSVAYGAEDGSVIINAAGAGLADTVSINIVGLEVNWDEVTVASEITYGATNASAVTLPAGGEGTATVDGDTVDGIYSVVDAAAVPNAGDTQITVKFTANSDEGDYAGVVIEKSYDITVLKAAYDMSKITANPQTSAYTGSSIDYAEANITKPADVTVAGIIYDATPVDAGTYTATISFTTSDTNYNNPTDVTATLTISKAVATAFVTEAPTGTATAYQVYEEYGITDAAGLKADLVAEGVLVETATVSYGEALTAEVEMTWADAAEEFDPKGGVYTFVGTPANDNLSLGSLTLTATFTITPVTGTLTTALNNITVAQAALAAADGYDDIKFPTSIEVTYGDGESATVIDSLTWTKTLDELKNVAVGSSVTVGLAADTFPAWATISGASDITFAVTDKLPVDVDVTMAAEGTYGTAMEAATAVQVDAGDDVDADGIFEYLYTGTTANGAAYSSADVPTEAGSYVVTATLKSSTHAGSERAEFTIAPKAIAVTVDDATKKYSDANPTFAIVEPVDGLVGEDDLNVTFSTTATSETPANTTAPITAVAANKNYNVTWTNGTLAIEPKPLSETEFVPVISGSGANGSDLTFAVAGLAADQYVWQWIDASTEAAYTLAWSDSNRTITVTITGQGNYEGTKTSEGFNVPKYEISGTLDFANDNGGENDDALDAGDVISVDTTNIVDIDVLEGLGISFEYSWTINGVEKATTETYTVPAATVGDLAVTITATENFAGSITKVIGEIGKAPLKGTITLTPAETEGVKTITADATAVVGDFDLVWYVGENQVTATEGVYTVTPADYGKTLTVKAVAKGELYSGEVAATYSIPAIAPSGVTIATSKTAASLTATLTADANGAAITSFSLTITDGAEYTVTVPVTANENGAFVHTFEGLTTGTTYTLTATATNSEGESAAASITAIPASTSRPRPSTPSSTPSTPSTTPTTPDAGSEGTGSEGTTTPDADVTVKVEDTTASIDKEIIAEKEAVEVATETESGTTVTTTVNVADANVESLEVSTKDAEKAAAGAAAEGAVGTPVEVKVDAKDAEGNKVNVTVNVAIPSEEKAYAYIVDENGVATRAESVYNEETGEVEVANVPDGAVVMLSTTAPTTFDDAAAHWAEETINYAVDAGIMNGVGGNTFDPDGKATRGMVNAMMVRLAKVAGIELAETGDHKVDTDANHWAAATDLVALANGWTTGVRTLEDGTVVMDTDATVTREQLVTMLWRFVAHPEAKGEITTFDDHADTSDWAREAKAWAVGAGIINGKPGNKLDPNGTATRAEIATMFGRLMAYMAK